MTTRSRLPALAIAGLLLAACSTQRETVSEADVMSSADVGAIAPAAPPAPVALGTAAADAAAAPATMLDSVSVSASRLRADEAKAKASAEVMRRESRQQIDAQAGILTAGDYDDLLNPQLYARYAQKYLQDHTRTTLPFVDTRVPLKVRVTGKDGKPVAFADVAAITANGEPLHLSTAANGIAVFFPALDKLPDDVQLTVGVAGSPTVRRKVTLTALGDDRSVHIQLPVAGRAPNALDLLLTIDTTGSMTDELTYLQVELDSIVASLRRIRPGTDIRVGLIVYRDQGDDYVTRSFPFTGDLADLRKQLGAQQANGGGDYPEAVERALAEAGRFDWRADAAKVLLHVADAPPHDELTGAAWEQALALRERGVHIVPVAASGVADEAQYLMRSMAALTQGRYLFLTDDSGVGLPHQEPDVPCYVVTRLDGLIERVVASLLIGRRVEPSGDAVLRRSGDYDRGVCLPASPRTGMPKISISK